MAEKLCNPTDTALPDMEEQPTESIGDAIPLALNPDHADKFCYTKGQIEFLDPDKVKIKKP